MSGGAEHSANIARRISSQLISRQLNKNKPAQSPTRQESHETIPIPTSRIGRENFNNTMKTKRITIEVTEETIQKSRRTDCHHCLIASALRDATGFDWHVWYRVARCEGDVTGRKDWPMPLRVREALNDFDAKRPVAPFSFTIPARFKR